MKFLKIAMMAVVLAVAGGSVSAPAWADGDAAKGKKVFNKCKACHKLVAGKKAIGPSLHGVFGRTAGTTKGYRFSKDMKAAGAKGLVWSEKTLDAFLAKPKPFIGKAIGKKKGRIKMAFGGLKKAKDRANIIAYLKKATK
jgi:cytochrome c